MNSSASPSENSTHGMWCSVTTRDFLNEFSASSSSFLVNRTLLLQHEPYERVRHRTSSKLATDTERERAIQVQGEIRKCAHPGPPKISNWDVAPPLGMRKLPKNVHGVPVVMTLSFAGRHSCEPD